MTRYTSDLAHALLEQPEVERVTWLAWSEPFPRLLYRGALPTEPPRDSVEGGLAFLPRLHYGWPPTWYRGRRLLRPCDVLHLQVNAQVHLPTQLVLARAAKKRPLVLTVHNARPHDSHEPHLRPLMAALTRRADVVVVHNETVRTDLLRMHGLVPERVRVLPHPRYPVTGDRDAGSARAHLGLPPDVDVLLFFGAIRPYKGLARLLRAMRSLPDVHLLVAGKPWNDATAIRTEVDSMRLGDRVHLFLEYVPDDEIPTYFAAADVVVFPFESFQGDSGSLKMAQSFEKPIVMTDALPRQEGAFVANNHDIDATLPEQLRRALADRRPAHVPLIDWTEFAHRTVQMYLDAAAEK